MTERYRSMDLEYVPQIIREYEYWTLAIHDDQTYLGRCYVWLLREGVMQEFTDLTTNELIEVQFIAKQWRSALDTIGWRPEFTNTAMLGNLFEQHGGHGHVHLIPRYKYPRTYKGIHFVDPNWGQNYPTDTRFRPDHELLHAIRGEIQRSLPKTDFG